MNKLMRVGIIGTGLQFSRRVPVLTEWPDVQLTAIASLHYEDAIKAAAKYNCTAYKTWEEVVNLTDLDIILVCTPPNVHSEISIQALKAGKHVLCEKPLSKTISEAEEMVKTANELGLILKCGFNHRHHPAIWNAKQVIDSGVLGKTIFGRCTYGICGRPGYEKEWRADPEIASGGHFIEQGSHVIDLFRWFLGEITEIASMSSNLYFKEQSLDDNGMAIFKTGSGTMACMHTSLTQWTNLFLFEIYCEDGYIKVEGLGASYDTEKLTIGIRDFSGPFTYTVKEYRGQDISWKEEWKEFHTSIKTGNKPLGSGEDGLACMKIALKGYQGEKEGYTKIPIL